MNSELKDIFIGDIIKQKVDELKMKHSDFAKRIHCSHSSLYALFNSKDISIEKLLLISQVLNYDFIGEVYHKETKNQDKTSICIPISQGDIDISDLPPEVLAWLKKQLVSK